MSDEAKAPSESEAGEIKPGVLQSDGASAEQAPAAEDESNVKTIGDPRRENLEALIAFRDRARDFDALLLAGTTVDVGGVPCRLLSNVPVEAATFRDEAIFAEHLALTPGNIGANAANLRNRYDGSGRAVGVNEDHGLNALDAEIARLEEAIAADEKAE